MSEVDDTTNRARLRERLQGLLKRVPPGVASGSYQKAVAFKKWHEKASKVANSDRATLAQLQSFVNEASNFS